MKDWQIRTIKTFVQSFFGTLIPVVTMMLKDGFPTDWPRAWAVLGPGLAAALSAAICAVWNIINEHLNSK